MSKIEEEYSQCIKALSDSDYTEDKIEECTGKNFLKVMLDIKYEIMKIMSRGDSTLRTIMTDNCYFEAEDDEIKSNACDLVE